MTNGGCSDMCNNTVPGYYCTCKPGYVLYTYNGTSGLTIPASETGLLYGDMYYINHTCVSKYVGIICQFIHRYVKKSPFLKYYLKGSKIKKSVRQFPFKQFD